MKTAQTPLHRVRGMGAAHTGTGHFKSERYSAAALIPLSLWFGYAMLGLAGTSEVTILQFLASPLNAILMAAFASTALYHMYFGLNVVVDDYVHTMWIKLFLRLVIRFFAIATLATCLFALLRITSV